MKRGIIICGVEQLLIEGKELFGGNQYQGLIELLLMSGFTKYYEGPLSDWYIPEHITSKKVFKYTFDSDGYLSEEPKQAQLLELYFRDYLRAVEYQTA